MRAHGTSSRVTFEVNTTDKTPEAVAAEIAQWQETSIGEVQIDAAGRAVYNGSTSAKTSS